MKKIFLILLFLPLLTAGQEREVNGRLMDADSLPVPGARITLLRTGERIVSDNAGRFRIPHARITDSIEVMAIGYHIRLLLIRQFNLGSLSLERDYTSLEAVKVETGYYQLPKERATGSFTVITADKLNEQVGTTIMERLPYVASGVTKSPDRLTAGPGIMVRGLSTSTLSIAKPLIILDNFPYEGDLENLNPNDVENITILKDAAAGSIWGAKAGNGVIVITTKKGKFNQRPKVEVNVNTSFIAEPDLKKLPLIGSSDIIDLEHFLFSRRYNFIDTLRATKPSFSPVYEILFARRSGKISAADSAAMIDELRGVDIRDEYQKYMYRAAVSRQFAASISGGSGMNAWSFSSGGDINTGTLHDKLQRISFMVNNTFKPIESIQITASLMYVNRQTESGRVGHGSMTYSRGPLPMYTRFADEDGNAIPIYKDYRKTYLDTAGGGRLLDWRFYPLTNYKYEKRNSSTEDINANLGFKWQIRKWIAVDLMYRRQSQLTSSIFMRELESYGARDLINSFTRINRSTGDITYIIPRGDIQSRSDGKITAQDFRSQLVVNHSWGEHSVSGLAGFHASDVKTESVSYTAYGYDPEILVVGDVDYVNRYPHYVTGSNTAISGGTRFSRFNRRQVAAYSNLAYSFRGKYHVTSSARRDASNMFGVAVNDRWSPLWSAGVKWDISKETFFKSRFVDNLSFRATYGRQGNVDPSKVAVTTFTYGSLNPFTKTPSGRINDYENPNLGWERVDMLNLGIDFGLFNGRLSGSVEHYQKYISDLYRGLSMEPTTGIFKNMVANIGSMRSHGWELQLNGLAVDKAFKWRINFVVNMNRERMTKMSDLPGVGESISGVLGTGFGGYNDYPAFPLFAYRWGGLDPQNGNPLGYLNGTLSSNYNLLTTTGTKAEDLVFVGRLLPGYSGSISHSFSWRSLSLVANLTYDFDYYFLRQTIDYSGLITQGTGHSDYVKRWQKPGDELTTNVPSFTYPVNATRDAFYRMTEVLAEKGDHVRLNYIQFSYRIMPKFLKRSPFRSVGLFVNANNLGILWRANKLGLDPNYQSLPPQKSYAIGIRFIP